MNKIVFFPTNNIGKFERYKNAFQNAGFEYNRYLQDENGESIKVEVNEDGKTTRENAEKKAILTKYRDNGIIHILKRAEKKENSLKFSLANIFVIPHLIFEEL